MPRHTTSDDARANEAPRNGTLSSAERATLLVRVQASDASPSREPSASYRIVTFDTVGGGSSPR